MDWKTIRAQQRRAYLDAIGASPEEREEARKEGLRRNRELDAMRARPAGGALPWLSAAELASARAEGDL